MYVTASPQLRQGLSGCQVEPQPSWLWRPYEGTSRTGQKGRTASTVMSESGCINFSQLL